jgi:hypothetical protein
MENKKGRGEETGGETTYQIFQIAKQMTDSWREGIMLAGKENPS